MQSQDVLDAERLNGALWHGDTQIDLVYNRLTDFMLEQSDVAVLRQAYLEHAIVLTPTSTNTCTLRQQTQSGPADGCRRTRCARRTARLRGYTFVRDSAY